ncbi:MAG: hypothetical protein POELPBGB_00008 [Bacteroidia bacterium]|nr:hypothetical protein [Bacteroidia bacterium]
MRYAVIILFIMLASQSTLAQSKDTVYWNAERKLKWQDFKGRPDESTNLLAMTQAGIGYEVACNNGELKVKVFCYFNVKKSWTKEEESDELLRHEQLHFDITELYTRKLRKLVSELEDPCGKNISKLNGLYEENMKGWVKAQDDYDRESEHSLNNEQQRLWDEKVARELKELKQYGSADH